MWINRLQLGLSQTGEEQFCSSGCVDGPYAGAGRAAYSAVPLRASKIDKYLVDQHITEIQASDCLRHTHPRRGCTRRTASRTTAGSRAPEQGLDGVKSTRDEPLE